ncbi:MAG: DUF4145 domain-containing protein [Gammaproteobacteria bacterium]|nr:DUF4145 domain-containing protein [Gammaproteobacteria bacterium]
MTSQTILEILEKNIKTIFAKLTTEETQQFVRCLSDIAHAENAEKTEDAMDRLYDFCIVVSFLKELLKHTGEPLVFERGKQILEPMTEKENEVHFIANRLIKAIDTSMSCEERRRDIKREKTQEERKGKRKTWLLRAFMSLWRKKHNRIAEPCSYHYLFSCIPGGELEEVQAVAAEIAAPLQQTYQLDQDTTNQIRQPSLDIIPLTHCANENSQTYLLQFFRVHDLLTTILTLNRTDKRENSLEYWTRTRTPHFPDREDRIGQTSILFAKAKPDVARIQKISKDCLDRELDETIPSCRCEKGWLYFLGQCSAERSDPRQSDIYILLMPKKLEKGDRFLSHSFPILESLRQTLVYEEEQAWMLKAGWRNGLANIKKLLEEIQPALNEEHPDLEGAQEQLLQVDDWFSRMHQDFFVKTRNLLKTLATGTKNFTRYLAALPLQDDRLFALLPGKFEGLQEQIRTDIEYAENDASALKQQWENLRRKWNMLAQKAVQQQLEPLPVRMWERELEDLREYYSLLHERGSQAETPEDVAKGITYVLKELDALFQTHVGKWILVSARIVLDAMLRVLYRKHFHHTRERYPALFNMIKRCYEEKNAFPEHIYYSMEHIRELGNRGAHPLDFSERQSKEILCSLATVLEWYLQEKGV